MTRGCELVLLSFKREMFEKLKYKCEMAFSYQLVILYIKKKQEYIDFKLKNYDMKS